MLIKWILAAPLCAARTAVESMRSEECKPTIGLSPCKGRRCRCPRCGRKAPIHDRAAHPRRRRTLDLGAMTTFLECRSLRIRRPEHGVAAATVPWAHHASRLAHGFEGQAAWLCANPSRDAVARLVRIDWKSAGPVCKRVCERPGAAAGNRLDGFVRIGIDEIGCRKGHKHMTVALNRDSGRALWCGKRHGKRHGKGVLRSLFKLPGPEQRASARAAAAGGARWIADTVSEFCPNAGRATGPLHVARWTADLPGGVLRRARDDARAAGRDDAGKRARDRPEKGNEPPASKSRAV